jgi:hypothetical protein
VTLALSQAIRESRLARACSTGQCRVATIAGASTSEYEAAQMDDFRNSCCVLNAAGGLRVVEIVPWDTAVKASDDCCSLSESSSEASTRAGDRISSIWKVCRAEDRTPAPTRRAGVSAGAC